MEDRFVNYRGLADCAKTFQKLQAGELKKWKALKSKNDKIEGQLVARQMEILALKTAAMRRMDHEKYKLWMTIKTIENRDEHLNEYKERVDHANNILKKVYNTSQRANYFGYISIDNYIKALDPGGVELLDHYSLSPVGLTLHRFGGFYWKFSVNKEWITLHKGESATFTLVGANWLSSTSDVFNNWVFTCNELSHCINGPQTILSTTHDKSIFPTNMANVQNFQRNSEDKWQSWDNDGGLLRYERYGQFTPAINDPATKDPASNDPAVNGTIHEGLHQAHIKSTESANDPRFEYRGLMVDVGRNFFPTRDNGRVDFFNELIDVMAVLKLNMLHLHLTEDQGWRLEIPGLQELTDFGAHRCYGNFNSTTFPCLWPSPQDRAEGEAEVGMRYFSRSRFIELLKYAHVKNVQIVPEIDLPAHSRAAVKCRIIRSAIRLHLMGSILKGIIKIKANEVFNTSQWGRTYDGTVNVCQPSAFVFIEKVVSEIRKMFEEADVWNDMTAPYFHIGGDETPSYSWQHSPACDKLIEENLSISSREDLFPYFIKRYAKIVDDHGFKVLGWEEVFIQNGEPMDLKELQLKNVPTVMPWNNRWHEENIRYPYTYANAGYKVVMATASHTYFDHPADASPNEPGFYWACRFNDVLKTFSFRPMTFYNNADYKNYGDEYKDGEVCEGVSWCPKLNLPENIIGIQGCLFSETMRNPEMLLSQVFPRMIALADRAYNRREWDESQDGGLSILQNEKFKTDWTQFKYTISEIITKIKSINPDFPIRLPLVGSKRITETMFELVNELDFDIIWRYRYGNVITEWKIVEPTKNGNSNIKILDLENELTRDELLSLNDAGTFDIDLATQLITELKNNQAIVQTSRIQSVSITNFVYSSAKKIITLPTLLLIVHFINYV